MNIHIYTTKEQVVPPPQNISFVVAGRTAPRTRDRRLGFGVLLRALPNLWRRRTHLLKQVTLTTLALIVAFSNYQTGPLAVPRAEAAQQPVTIILKSASTSPWTVPANWNSASNTIEVIGPGGTGSNSVTAGRGGAGGGGGAYAKVSNLSLTPESTISFTVGLGGNTGSASTTWFQAHNTVKAGGGANANAATGGAGGVVLAGSGSAGGKGGDASATAQTAGAGGGGAGGPNGVGGAGGNSSGTTGHGGSGGGGHGGGYPGSTASSATGANGGNNYLNADGGTGSSGNGTNGGGGAGGGGLNANGTAGTGGNGSMGSAWGFFGTGGGGGGGGSNARTGGGTQNGGNGGAPAADSGAGGGGAGAGNDNVHTGATGANGFIVITYTPIAPSITISGTVYTDEGQTPLTGSPRTLIAAIGTSTLSIHATTTNTSTGAFSFTISDPEINVSTPIVVYIDGASEKATTFTKASSTSGNISGLDLYQNRVIVRHEGTSGTSTTNANMAFYDGDDDSDIQYTSNGGALSVRAGNKLFIWANDVYAPGGAVTVHGNAASNAVDGSFHIATGATYTAGGNTTVAGHFTASSTAVFTPSTHTLTLNATTTGKIIDTLFDTLGSTTFNGVGGAWSFSRSTATTSSLTITNGTLTAPTTNLIVTGNYTNNGTFTAGSGTTTFSGTSPQIFTGTMTGTSAFAHVVTTGAGTKTFADNASTSNLFINTGSGAVIAPSVLSIAGNYTNNGTFTHNSGTTTFSGTSAQTLTGTMTGTSAFANVVTTGAGTKTFANNASTSNLFINTGSGAVIAPSVLSIAGNYTNNATFTAGSGTTTFDGTSTQTATGTMTGTSAFNNLSVTNNTATTTFGSALTAINFTATQGNSKLAFAAGTTTTFTNALITGSALATTTIRSTTPGVQSNLTITASYSLSYLDVKDSNACGSVGGKLTVIGNNVTDSGNNTCWTFAINPNDYLTVSGVLYESNRTTPQATPATLTMALVATSTFVTYSTTTTPTTGAFSFNVEIGQLVATSTPVTVYLDNNNATLNAVTVTKTNGSPTITSLDLYQDHVTIKNEGGIATTTKATDLYAFASSTDSDLVIVASSTLGRLTVSGTTTLLVASSTTFHVDLPLYTHSFETATSAVTQASSTMTLTGDYHNGGAFWSAATTTWTNGTVDEANFWNSVTYGNGRFVAVGSSGDRVMHSTDGLTWATTSAAGNNDGWYGITYGNGLFVAVGNSGDRVMHSTDGLTWAAVATSSAAGNNDSWRSVTYGNGRFVAVGNSGDRVMHSTDGLSWATTSAAGDNDSWYSVTYGNGLFVAVGVDGDRVMHSTDGLSWATTSAAGNNDSWYGVTYGNGRFVAVGESGDRVMHSTDGLTWDSQIVEEFIPAYKQNRFHSVTYGNGLFVAVGVGSNYNYLKTPIFVSSDGITWTARTNSKSNWWQSVTYGNGRFVAVGNSVMSSPESHTILLTGTDTQLISGSLTGNNSLPGVRTLFGGGKTFLNNASTTDLAVATSSGLVTLPNAFTLTGNYGNLSLLNAPDEFYFTGGNQTATGTWNGSPNLTISGGNVKTFATQVTVNNVYVANDSEFVSPPTFAVGGNYVNNGSTTPVSDLWIPQAAPMASRSVTYGNGRFVAVGDSGDRVMHSTDGITWATTSAAGNNDSWTSVTYGNGRFVAVGGSGDRVMHSTDGLSWATTSAAGDNDSWLSVTYGNGRFVAVGGSGDRVMHSTDGLSWTAVATSSAAGNDDIWRSVTYGNGRFVAVGSSGDRVMHSTNGLSWATTSAAGNNDSWYGVTYGNGRFVAVGNSGDGLMYSSDGLTWATTSVAGDTANRSSVTYGNGRFVAVGGSDDNSNLAITSLDGISWEMSKNEFYMEYWSSVTYGNGRFVAVSSGASYGAGTNAMISIVSTTTFSGASAQSISGSLTGASALGNVVLTGAGTKTFNNNASTTNFVVEAGATAVAPAQLSLYGDFTNSGTFTPPATTTFMGDTQTLSGTLTGSSAFNTLVFSGNATKTIASNASTTHLINGTLATTSTSTLVLPAHLSIAGDFTQLDTLVAGTGTTTFSGASAQTATGTMTGMSAFGNVVTTGAGTKIFGAPASTTNLTIGTTATNTFTGPLSVSGNLTVTTPSAKLTLPASATTTVSGTTTITGTAGNEVRLRSTIDGTRFGFYTNTYTITYADIKDSSGSSTLGAIDVTGGTNIDSGNNVGWTFTGAAPGDTFTLSGILYESDRVTPVAASQTLVLAVATSTVSLHTTNTTVTTGAFTFSIAVGDIATGTPLTVFVDGNATLKAVTVTKALSATAATLTNRHLYQNHLTLNTPGTTTQNADLSAYTNQNDSDIPFTLTGTGSTTLTTGYQQSLYIASTTIYAPEGNTTIGASLIAANTASTNLTGYTQTFTSTTTGNTLNTPTATYGNVVLNGNGGAWSFAQSAATTSGLTIASGASLTAPNSLTIYGDFMQNGSFDAGSGTVYLDGVGNRTVTGLLTAGNALNHVEFVNTTTAFGEAGGVTDDPTSGNDFANGITSDDTAVYVTGYRASGGALGGNAYYTVAYDKTTGATLWATTTDPTSGNDYAEGITSDATAVYVTGYRASGGALGGAAYYTVAYAKDTGATLWATTTDPTSDGDYAYSIAVDATTVYVTGSRASGGPLGGIAYYTVAYDKTTGATLWATTTDPTSGNDWARGITSDATTVYVTGSRASGGPLGGIAYYTVAYDKTTGATLWATTTDPTSGGDTPSATTVDTTAVYVTGYCTGCGPLGGAAYYTVAYAKDTGATLWATTTDPTSGEDRANGITSDTTTIYVTGYRASGGALGGAAYYTVAYAKDTGATLWDTTTDPTGGTDIAYGITSDATTVYVTGYRASGGPLGGNAYYTVAYAKDTGQLLFGLNSFTLASTTRTANLTIATTTTTLTGTDPLTVSGNITIYGTYAHQGELELIGTGKNITGTVSGISLGTTTISGSYTAQPNYFTNTGDLTIENGASLTASGETITIQGDFTIQSGGAFTAPTNNLTLRGDFIKDGAYTHNGATLIMDAYQSTSTIVGTVSGASALTNLIVTNSGYNTFGVNGSVTTDLTSGTDWAAGITVDDTTVYVTGHCTGCGPLGSGAYHTVAYDKVTGATLWATTTDPTSGNDQATGITVDATTVYVTGHRGSGGALGGAAYYTIAYDKTTGATLWATTTDPTSGADVAQGITSDATTVYVTGYRASGGALGLQAYYTVAYDKTTGATLWATTTDPTSSNDQALAITSDATTVYVTGYRASGGPLGLQAYYTVAYDKDTGATLWATTTDPTSGEDRANGITSDATTVYVTGHCTGCGPLGSAAYYTVAYDKDTGATLWATTTDPTSGGDYAFDITSDATTVYVTGHCTGCGPLGSAAYYTVAYDKDTGATLWATTTDSTSFNSDDRASGITVDATTVYVTGKCDSGCGPLGSGAYHTVAYDKFDGGIKKNNTNLVFASSQVSVTDLTIANYAATVVAPPQLSISGNYENQGTFTAGTGTTTFSGTSAQTATGTMTGTSAFANVVTTGAGTKTFGAPASTTNLTIGTTATNTFSGALTVSGNLTVNTPSAKLALPASATTTVSGATTVTGTAGNEVRLRSTEDGTRFGFALADSYAITYADVKDSSGTTTGGLPIDVTDGTTLDSGGNNGWNFGEPGEDPTLVSAAHQTFIYGAAATPISPITITESLTPTITTTNDLRIRIATTTVNMRWDTTDTTADFGGTAASKVAGTVSYEQTGGVLVIDVTENFTAGDTLTVSGLAYTSFNTVNTATPALTLHITGAVNETPAATDTRNVTIMGALTATDHPEDQVESGFSSIARYDIPLYRFTLTPQGEDAVLTTVTVTASGVQGIEGADISNLRLYHDVNTDGLQDGGDTLISTGEAINISGQSGTLTLTVTHTVTTAQSFVLVGDVANLRPGDQMNLSLSGSNLVATGNTTSAPLIPTSAVSTIQHNRGGQGTRGNPSLGPTGGEVPEGEVVTGGGQGGGTPEVDTNTGGDTLTGRSHFFAPTAEGTPRNEWQNGNNGIDSDGAYVRATTDGLRQSYTAFDFGVPSGNQITGIEVLLEASATSSAGTIEVRLSGNNGSSYSSSDATPTLTTSDTIYSLGGASDTWGEAWTADHFTNGNFILEVIAHPSSNAVQIDALLVRVYHQTVGGNEGGGGGEARRPGLLPFAGSTLTERITYLTETQRATLLTALNTLETVVRRWLGESF